MKRPILLLLILFLFANILSAQETYLQLFDRILVIEDKLDNGITDELLAEIESVREQIENSPFADLRTRLQIIDHIIKARTAPGADFQENLDKEITDIGNRKKIKTFNTLTLISGGTSLLAGATLTTSLLLAESMHEQFLAADTPAEAADFLYKRDMLDTVSWISGGVLALGVVATSTLIALRPAEQQIQGKSYLDFGPELSTIAPGDSLFANLVAKRVNILNEIEQIHQLRESRMKLINFTKYAAISGVAATGLALVFAGQVYSFYNRSDDYETVRTMKAISQTSLALAGVTGAISVICFSANIYLNGTTNDRKLREALKEVDNEIINYPFQKEAK